MKKLGAELNVGEGASVKVFLAVVFGERLGTGKAMAWALWADVDVGELTCVHVCVVNVNVCFVANLDAMNECPTGGETSLVATVMLGAAR